MEKNSYNYPITDLWLKDDSGHIPEYSLRCSGPRITNKKIDTLVLSLKKVLFAINE
jgi:hypothetical protein